MIFWWMCFAGTLSQMGDYYFLDGIELHLTSGVVIMTAEEVKEDRFTYSWREEGEFWSFDKRNVKSVKYFSWVVEGLKPKKETKTAVQRRISGDPIVYETGGQRFLKVRHVDQRGRSTEGRVHLNLVDALWEIPSEAEQSTLALSMVNVEGEAELELRFYDLKGQLLYKVFVDLDTVSRTRKERKEATLSHQFSLPDAIDLKSLGLVEVMVTSKK